MGHSHVRFRATLHAPIELVFAQLTDHEDMRNWPGVTDCRLIREGTPRNGVGAIRVVSHPLHSVTEEVNLYEPPHRFGYSIIKGPPIRHQGTVTLVERGERTELEWDVKLSSRIPLLAQVLGRFVKRGLGHVFATYFIPKVEAAARSGTRPSGPQSVS
ncbi:SRPBCC family protein [Hyalangium versicolor]|uniref:SRPBCC family protein n=1 Tax=Hyalangium versicolor TaxID=2861190 RepID=UPI001CCFC47F|nr:SRPBCC family protein [Hyalangium versicolor]